MIKRDPESRAPKTSVELVDELSAVDLSDLCDAAEMAINDGGGFGWLAPPPRDVLESYWKGVLLIPERDLLIGRLDDVNIEVSDVIVTLAASIVAAPEASISSVVAFKSTDPAVPPPIVIFPRKSKVVVSVPSDIPI